MELAQDSGVNGVEILGASSLERRLTLNLLAPTTVGARIKP